MAIIREDNGDARANAGTQYDLSEADVFEGKRLVMLLILGLAAFDAGADKTPLLLSCHGIPKTDAAVVATLCDALATELDKRKPDRVIRRSAAPDPLPKRAWDIILEVTRTEDYHWEARLVWAKIRRKGDAKRTTGPDVEIFGMDAPLGPGAYPHFIRSLLKVSKPEFLASPRGVEPLLPP